MLVAAMGQQGAAEEDGNDLLCECTCDRPIASIKRSVNVATAQNTKVKETPPLQPSKTENITKSLRADVCQSLDAASCDRKTRLRSVLETLVERKQNSNKRRRLTGVEQDHGLQAHVLLPLKLQLTEARRSR